MLAVHTSSISSFMQLIEVFLIFVFILVITYFTTRWIAGYQKGHSFNKNLKVIETLKLTTNKYVQIIKAGSEYLVIAISKDDVRFLTKLTEEELKDLPTEESQVNLPTENFKDIFDNLKRHFPKK